MNLLAVEKPCPDLMSLQGCEYCDGETRWRLRDGVETLVGPGVGLKSSDLVLIDRPKVYLMNARFPNAADLSGGVNEMPRWLYDQYKRQFGDQYPDCIWAKPEKEPVEPAKRLAKGPLSLALTMTPPNDERRP